MNKLLAVGAMAILVGCASAPSQKQTVSSISQVAGDWHGMVYYKGGSMTSDLTINPDGTYTVRRSNGSTGGGTTKIEEGRLYWVGGGATGEWELSGHPPDEMILSRNTLSGNNAFGGYSNQVEVRYKRAK